MNILEGFVPKVEVYVLMRLLELDSLEENYNIYSFDAISEAW